MKKLFAFLAAAIISVAACAQATQGDIAVGANFVYGSGIENVGLGARFQYTFIDHLRGEVGFNYFFKKHGNSWADININAEWLVTIKEDKFFVYPIAGLNYTMANFKVDVEGGGKRNDEENHVGLNLGAGLQYNINDHFGVSLEYRHTIIRKVDQGVLGLGVNYKF